MLTKIAEPAHHSRLTVATLASLVYIAGLAGLAVFLGSESTGDARQITMLVALPVICLASVALPVIWKRADR